MIELNAISKIYRTGTTEQRALDDVSVSFRDAEFVSILGASGSGKTTLLNIIGGLDHASSGELSINGKTTSEYKSSDWDTYRNHHVGFIFQSYNLIPHQSVLSNVEIALTLSGVSAQERQKRALAVLDRVGLSEHVNKKPNQLSGGQAQRVAIARALVNDPDIILADEPTGALDTATGIQIMEILKDVSSDRLVIMVTHNPELAEEYATRIVTISDGKLLNDTDPYTPECTCAPCETDKDSVAVDKQSENKISETEDMIVQEEIMLEDPAENLNAIDPTYIMNVVENDKDNSEANETKDKKRASMSFTTALSLSFNNLMTKKGRTFLTAFAGSIGITGIAIILALSNGVNNYVQKTQRDALAGMPLVISRENVEFFTPDNTAEVEPIELPENSDPNEIQPVNTIEQMYRENKNEEAPVGIPVKKNNLKPFKLYLDNNKDKIDPLVTSIAYDYNAKPVFMLNKNGEYTVVGNNLTDNSDPLKKLQAAKLLDPSKKFSSNGFAKIFDNTEIVKSFFTLEKGKWPQNAHEAILVLDENGRIDDFVLYGIGVIDNKEVDEYVKDATNKNKPKEEKKAFPKVKFTYDDALDLKYTAIPSAYTYVKDGKGYKQDLSEQNLKKISAEGFDIQVVGVIKPIGTTGINLTPGIYYHESLPTTLIEKASETEIVKQQLAHPKVDVFTGKTFKQLEQENENPFGSMGESDISDFIPELPQVPEIAQIPDPTEQIEGVLNPDNFAVSQEQIDASVDAVLKNIDTKQLMKVLMNVPSPDIDKLDLSNLSEQDKNDVVHEAVGLAQRFVPWYMAELPKLEPHAPIGTIVYKYLSEPASVASLNKIEQLVDQKTKTKVKDWLNDYLDKTLVPYLEKSLNPVVEKLTQEATNQINMIMGQKITEISQVLSGVIANQLASIQALSTFPPINIGIVPQIPNLPSDIPGGLGSLKNLFENNNASYEDNLTELGYANIDDPESISFYPKSFDDKAEIEKVIEEYNKTVTDEGRADDVITYSDLMKFFVGQVVEIINTISLILIAFVSVSLVVSSIMIGIITYISVLERKKEIGILRAMGASRRNIANVFNAETTIEGFISGIIAIVFVYIVSIPINIFVENAYKIEDVMNLPITDALMLLGVAILLNLIAGLIPSSKAAHRDPVEALRSE